MTIKRAALQSAAENALMTYDVQGFCSWFESFYNFDREGEFTELENKAMSKLLDVTSFYTTEDLRSEYPGYTSEDDVHNAIRDFLDIFEDIRLDNKSPNAFE